MVQRYEATAEDTAELIENVGVIADRLLASCTPTVSEGDVDTRALLERALMVAAEAQQQLAAQSQRIATLEALSFKDELTGLYNRRGFYEQLQRSLAVADRLGTTGVLAFIDFDQFKAVNDGLGHQAGDTVLRHVARLLKSNTRTTDVLARLGGDEFAAILVHTPARSGRKRAQSLDRLLNASVVAFGESEIPVRASFGIKCFGPGDDVETLVARADAAMYRNKRAKPSVLHTWRKRG